MDERLAKIESDVAVLKNDVAHIQGDVSELRTELRGVRQTQERDFRILFGAIISVALGLSVLMARVSARSIESRSPPGWIGSIRRERTGAAPDREAGTLRDSGSLRASCALASAGSGGQAPGGHVQCPACRTSKDIPVVQEQRGRSGEKYVTPQGFTAIRDGIKARRRAVPGPAAPVAQAALAAGQAPTGAGFQARQGAREGAPARHGVRRGQVPEHRRVLERGHRHHHADGRGVHARLPLLLGRHRQSARLARRRGAARTRRAPSS